MVQFSETWNERIKRLFGGIVLFPGRHRGFFPRIPSWWRNKQQPGPSSTNRQMFKNDWYAGAGNNQHTKWSKLQYAICYRPLCYSTLPLLATDLISLRTHIANTSGLLSDVIFHAFFFKREKFYLCCLLRHQLGMLGKKPRCLPGNPG
jgi:hypothetical protein